MKIAEQIELYLLDRPDWIPIHEICDHFGIDQRALRADGVRRPLCRHFAISSSTKGLKHLRHTTVEERLKYKHARRKVLIAQARALKEYNEAICLQLTGRPFVEKLTGQRLLF